MKKNLLILFIALVGLCDTAFGWGKTGHDAIAAIAEANLTPRAKRHIEKYLDGHSIIFYSTWMDQVRYTKEYSATSRWHGFATDEHAKYRPTPGEDGVEVLNQTIERLRDYRNLDDSTVRVSIYYLIHIVGDMHCPVHIRYPWYERFVFKIEGTPYILHKYWDGLPDMAHRWSYAGYVEQLDRCSKAERRALAAGTPLEWAAENAERCRVIYDWVKADEELTKRRSHALMLKAQPLCDEQILKAGYRLARLLNELFG